MKKNNPKPFSHKAEKNILKFWKDKAIFSKFTKKNQGKKRWSFLDGPITANNPMGVHHAWGRTYKDLFQRFFAMRGYDQRFQNGFDAQGLWVEVEVEKELGMKSKKDIEKYGVAKFIKKCKDRVSKYAKIQTEQSINMGQWMDWDHSYYTSSDENNYAIWHFLKKCWEKDLLYKGRDVVPWCTRCGTAISQHEILSEEYQKISHKSVFVKLPTDIKNRYLLIWTTTPWTLPANVAVAVKTDMNYVVVKDKNNNQEYVLANSRIEYTLGQNWQKDFEIVKKLKGKNLLGLKYKGIFSELDTTKNIDHKVVAFDDVSEDEGTGLVHIAPGCGQEDFQLAKDLNLDVIDPIDESGNYVKGFGPYSEKNVSNIADDIILDLKQKNILFKFEDYMHRYPVCWRCKRELVFRLVDEWYIKMDPLRKPLKKIVEKIKWLPDFGKDLELDWLKSMSDWMISKKRYWGLALPIFECKKCNNFEVIGGKDELKKRAISGWEEFDQHSPHKPWADKVKIECKECGEISSRIKDVGNPWLDAGIVPFSTMSYFKNKSEWQKWFPADFICESFPGQFKNWFYSLLAMSCVLENKTPFKTILGHAKVLDEKGNEMHKSTENVIWLDDAIENASADVMRLLYASVNPYSNLNFGYKVANNIKRKLLLFWNVFNFFKTYAKIDNWSFDHISDNSNNILDKWITSRLQQTIVKTTKNLKEYNSRNATKSLENFVQDLSLWYLRRSRKRRDPLFYSTLYQILMTLVKLYAPIIPFSTELIYQDLKTSKDYESVHLNDWPKADLSLIDKKLTLNMKKVRKIVELGFIIRNKAEIKVRQPLLEILVKGADDILSDNKLVELILDELNVENVKSGFKKTMKNKWINEKENGLEVSLNIKLTTDLKEKGIVRDIIRLVQQLRKKADLLPNQKINANYYTDNNKLSKLILANSSQICKKTNLSGFSEIDQKDNFSGELEIENSKILVNIIK